MTSHLLSVITALLLELSIGSASALTQVPWDDSGLKGSVVLVVLNSFGDPLPDAKISIQRLDVKNNAPEIIVANDEIATLEYGTYRVTAAMRNYAPSSI